MCACAGSTHSVSPARTCRVRIKLVHVLLLSIFALLARGPCPASSVPVSEFFPFGTDVGDSMTERTDDGGSGRINLTVIFPFFGNRHDKLYVNNNGVISFFKELRTYRPENFPLQDEAPIIAPYWADVDIRGSNATVWYRESRDPSILSKATAEIRAYHSAYSNFRAYWALVATWDEVGFYGASPEGLKKKNTFQAVLVLDDTGRQSFVILNYAKIEWTTGSNSQGNPETGLGGSPAQAGFNAGDKTNYFEIEGARSDSVINLTQTSNVGIPGKWIFRIDSAAIQSTCSESESGGLFFRPMFGSMLGGSLVEVDGPCFNSNTSVRGQFDSGEELCCYVEEGRALCTLPPVFDTGPINVSLNIDEKGWNYNGRFIITNVLDVKTEVKRHSPEKWMTGSKVRVSWKERVEFLEIENFLIEILEFKIKDDIPDLHVVYSKDATRKTDGKYALEMPRNFSGLSLAVVKVTGISGQCDGLGPSIYSDVFPVQYESPSTSEQVCSDWLSKESKLPLLETQGQCPCTLTQAEGDTAQYSKDPFCKRGSSWPMNCQYRSQQAGECITPNRGSGPSGTYVCCYDKDSGELLNALEGTGGGTQERYHYRQGHTNDDENVIPYFTYLQQDITPYLHCCDFTSNETLCDQFLQIRQPVGCQGYQPPAAAQAAGDPHIETLDRHAYTFNGVGEFTLLRIKDTQATVQVKATPALDADGQPQNATVFTALAMQASNTSSVLEIRLEEQELYSVHADNEPFDLSTSTSQLSGMTVYRNNSGNETTELTVVMDELGLSVLIEITQELLNIMVIASSQLKNRLEGLLGNFNDDSTDDLMTRNGTLLSPDANMRDVHYIFGLSWAVGNESLFQQAAASDFDNIFDDQIQVEAATYEPVFIDEIMTEGLQNETKNICQENTQCIFDYEVTGKETIALSTLKFNERFEERKREIMPVIRCPYVSVIPNANRTLSGLKVGDTVTVDCDAGYNINGSGQLTCEESGQWSGSPPVCVTKLSKENEFPYIYVAAGAASGGFVLIVVFAVIAKLIHKRCSGRSSGKKEESGSEFEQAIELPSIFPISDIPSPVFENSVFMSSLQKLSEKGSFRIPRPTYVDPNIYTEYF